MIDPAARRITPDCGGAVNVAHGCARCGEFEAPEKSQPQVV
jgi:hypothetical protein